VAEVIVYQLAGYDLVYDSDDVDRVRTQRDLEDAGILRRIGGPVPELGTASVTITFKNDRQAIWRKHATEDEGPEVPATPGPEKDEHGYYRGCGCGLAQRPEGYAPPEE
jgi:hypothetical protein